MSETPLEQEQAEVEATTPPSEPEPVAGEEVEAEPSVEEIEARTQAAVEDAGQPIPDDQAPGYNDEAQKDSPDIEGSDAARRVHPDTGGYQYEGEQ